MKVDPIRIKQYLAEIRNNSMELNQLIDNIFVGKSDFDEFITEIESYIE